MTIYIAGPMRGKPDYNYPAFDSVAEKLRADGWTVYNPAEMSEHYGTADELAENAERLRWLMDEELRLVREQADAIFLLDGWETSEGAREELAAYLAEGKRNVIVQPRADKSSDLRKAVEDAVCLAHGARRFAKSIRLAEQILLRALGYSAFTYFLRGREVKV